MKIVIGEEAADRDPALLHEIPAADLAFIVDPLDGTKNFVSGLPLFGMMASATKRGEVVAAAIHDPICGDTAYALRDGGADTARRARDERDAALEPPLRRGRHATSSSRESWRSAEPAARSVRRVG